MTRRGLWLALVVALLCLAVPATAQTPAATPGPETYVVQPGDTLAGIAERLGTTVEALVAANSIADPSLILAGQELVIPAPEPEVAPPSRRVHPVGPDDTLPALAFRYRTTTWALREANGLDRLGVVLPRQALAIPSPLPALHGPAAPSVTLEPAVAVQGQTVAVQVRGEGELVLQARLLDLPLVFLPERERYWALLGVDAVTPPGAYTLVLTATETASGDVIAWHETLSVTAGTFPTANIAVPAGRQNLLDPELGRAEREKVEAVFAGLSEVRQWSAPFGLPLAGELRQTAPFGQRRSYAGGPVAGYHAGYDLGADEGTPVYATAPGTVVLAEPLQVRGQAVILDHGWGVFTGFWHLSRIDVTVGQAVGQGDVIGLVGNTGLSTGPHLHWEMQVRGVPVDAFQWTRQALP